MKILITGGTGLIGTAISKSLIAKGHEIIILSRKPPVKNSPGISYARWDIKNNTIEESAIRDADHIIHLAGANLAEGRWTKSRKKEIIDSRVRSAELLVDAMNRIPNNVRSVISASAIGYYGPDKVPFTRPFIESDPPYHDFLAQVVKEWEGSISAVTALNKRLVIFRAGLVLSNDGGAFREFKKPFRFGLSTILGTGKQAVSWIHIDDVIRLYADAIENDSWQGVYNAVSPMPVTNRQLIQTIRKELGGFSISLRVPSLVLKIVLGEMSIEVLKSATVSSEKIQAKGFVFRCPVIETAIRELVASGNR